MKRKSDPEEKPVESEYKKGITIDTNLHQIVAIVVIFLAMFVLPIQVYTLYKNKDQVQTATYTTQGQGVQNGNSSEGDVLGAFDSVIPSSLKTNSHIGNYILYGGIVGLILAVIIFLAIIIK